MRRVSLPILFFLFGVIQSDERSDHNGTRRGFIFTVPKVLVVNTTEMVCLTLFNVTDPYGQLRVTLYKPDNVTIISAMSHFIRKEAHCYEMFIPVTKIEKGLIGIEAQFDNYPDYKIDSKKDIRFQISRHMTFIQTDKPIYHPGHQVKFRLLSLYPDLKPVMHEVDEVYIEDPHKIRVAQWKHVETNRGLVDLRFQLTPETVMGTWKINALVEGMKFSHEFNVDEYILPTFSVEIISPPYILNNAESFPLKICAKYTYGMPVEGNYTLEIYPFTRAFLTSNKGSILILEGKINGCFENIISSSSMGMDNITMAPYTLFVKGSVAEQGTGKRENVSTNVDIRFQALKFEIDGPRNFKPGLSYNAEIHVLHLDNKPAINTLIELCLTLVIFNPDNDAKVECKNFTSNRKGIIPFVVPPQHISVSQIRIKAVAVEFQKQLYTEEVPWFYVMQQPMKEFEITAWYSPSYSFIRLSSHRKSKINCGDELRVRVDFTSTEMQSITFHYLIISRGNILNWKQQVHEPNNHGYDEEVDSNLLLGRTVEFLPYESERYDKDPGSPMPDNLLTGKFNIRFNIIPEMADSLHLLVYYIRDDSEVVADSMTIETEPCFNNKVTLQAEKERVTPGEAVKMTLTSSPDSLCALSAVDKNIHLLGKEKPIDANAIFGYIRSYNLGRENQPIQVSEREECGLSDFPFRGWGMRAKRSFIPLHFTNSYIDSLEAFNSAGLVVVSDMQLSTKPCSKSLSGFLMIQKFSNMVLETEGKMPQAMLLNSVDSLRENELSSRFPPNIQTRDYFPETWLWDFVIPDEAGDRELSFNIPHSITTWKQSLYCISGNTGFGVAPPIEITAFQPFFVDFSTPYAIKRGETMVLKVKVFNYLQEDLPIEIELEGSPDYIVSGRMRSQTCMKGGKGHFHKFEITPKIIGEARISVLATIAPDYPKSCGPEFLLGNIRDRIVKTVHVEPEGFPVIKTKSVFFCLNSPEDTYSAEWDLSLPENVIPGSDRAWFALTGDLLGPALNGLHSLVRMPIGCGEQNMVLFTPNIYVIKYLRSINHLTPELEENILKNLESGYQKELKYKHPDGSYSAFGSKDEIGSIWLTAFVVKSFAQAQQYIHIDKQELEDSMRWITKRQLENGCFPVVGMVHQKDMKGGLDDHSVLTPLTAYILISLMESGVRIPADVLNSGWYCLKADRNPTIYTQALSAYAFALGRRTEAPEYMKRLLQVAKQNEAMLWWQVTDKEESSINIEITAYCVLTMITLGDPLDKPAALKAVRWIASQGNGNGGFISTQDTVLALQALAYYSSQISLKKTRLNVTVTENSGTRELSIVSNPKEDNRLLQQTLVVPELPTSVGVSVTGQGCGLLQVSSKYHTKTSEQENSFNLNVWDEEAYIPEPCLSRRLHICVSFVNNQEPSNMVVIEINMVSGYSPERAELEALTNAVDIALSRWEIDGNTLALYFSELTKADTCFSFVVTQEVVVLEPKPGRITVYDYYQSEKRMETAFDFNTCNESPHLSEYPEVLSVSEDLSAEEDLGFPDLDEIAPMSIAKAPEGFPVGQCPVCLNKFPLNLADLYCDSYKTVMASVLSARKMKLSYDVSYSKKKRERLRNMVTYSVPEGCQCQQLKKGESIIILNFDEELPKQKYETIEMKPGYIIIRLSEGIGEQEWRMKNIRKKC